MTAQTEPQEDDCNRNQKTDDYTSGAVEAHFLDDCRPSLID